MKTSDTVAAIHEAIAKVQAAIEPITKNKEVKVSGEKASWASSYATLSALDAAVRPALNTHGIALIQSTDFVTGAGAVKSSTTSSSTSSTDSRPASSMAATPNENVSPFASRVTGSMRRSYSAAFGLRRTGVGSSARLIVGSLAR